MGDKPKLKELMRGTISCPGCSKVVYISDYKGLEISPCPACNTPLFIPFKIKNYWLYKPLGGGGMGSVYQALSEYATGEFAIKILPREQNTNQELINSITREGEIGIVLGKAPNIAEVVEYGCEDGEYFLASRFVEGTRLDIFISTASHLSERQALDIILQVIDAEIHIINCGFLYRDIKPENIIIVEETSLVKVFDFGLCMSLEQAANPDENDALEGSPYYLPPERIVAAAEGEHSEIYSLGMLLFHMLSGTTYFSQAEIKDLLTKHVGSLRVASVSNRLTHCSPQLSTILDKMIKRDPNQRYHELVVLRKELEDLCNEAEGYSLTETSNTSSTPGNKVPMKDISLPPAKTKSSKKSLKVLLVVLALVAVGVGGWHLLNAIAANRHHQEILVQRASNLGIALDVQPPELTLNEVESLVSERFNQEYEELQYEFAPFDDTLETANICKKFSISVPMEQNPKWTIARLEKMAEEKIRKDMQRELALIHKAFSEKETKEEIAQALDITLPIAAPTRTLKEVQAILYKKTDKATRKKYSSKEFASQTMAILKKYKSYKKGDKVSVVDHAGFKLTGIYKGREGNKILIGNRKIMLSDIDPSKKIKFNQALCARQAANEIQKVKSDFKKKRWEFKQKYIKKTAKDIYKKYGYTKNKGNWNATNEVIATLLKQEKQKSEIQRSLKKKKIEKALKKDFNKNDFIKKHGYRKIKGKWYSEKETIAKLVKQKKDIFDKKRDKTLAKLKIKLKHKVEKEVYLENGYIYFHGKWQPMITILHNESKKIWEGMK